MSKSAIDARRRRVKKRALTFSALVVAAATADKRARVDGAARVVALGGHVVGRAAPTERPMEEARQERWRALEHNFAMRRNGEENLQREVECTPARPQCGGYLLKRGRRKAVRFDCEFRFCGVKLREKLGKFGRLNVERQRILELRSDVLDESNALIVVTREPSGKSSLNDRDARSGGGGGR